MKLEEMQQARWDIVLNRLAEYGVTSEDGWDIMDMGRGVFHVSHGDLPKYAQLAFIDGEVYVISEDDAGKAILTYLAHWCTLLNLMEEIA